MKFGIITTITQKGQVVIPQLIRKSLGMTVNQPVQISQRGNGVYIVSVDSVVTSEDRENSFVDLLKKTQGTWHDEDWEKIKKERSKKELSASQQRKSLW